MHNQKRNGAVFLAFSLFFILLIAQRSFFSAGYNSARVWLYQKSAQINIFLGGLNSADSIKENSALKSQVADLIFTSSELLRYKNENEQLKKILKLQEALSYKKINAQVLASGVELPDTLLVNAGQDQGVKKGQVAVTGEGSVAGRVITVGKSTSLVAIITDANVRLPFAVAGNRSSLGIAQGQYGLSVLGDLIPQNSGLKAGDILVTTDLDALVPPGLAIGRVNRFLSSDNDLFAKVAILPAANLDNLAFLTIIDTAYGQ